MKHLLPILAITLLAVFASAADETTTTTLAGKPAKKFSTTGHAKSKGARITIKYPADWTAAEGDRPNVVQKFVNPTSTAVVLVGTKQLPGAAPTEAEAAEMFADRAKTLELTPTSSQVVAHTPTKLEAEPAVILECTDTRERAGITLVTHNLFLTFFRGNTMVTVTCMVGGPESEAEKIEKAWKAQKPMFQAMFSSIVFEDKWK